MFLTGDSLAAALRWMGAAVLLWPFPAVIPSDSEGSCDRQAYEPGTGVDAASVALRARDPSALRASGWARTAHAFRAHFAKILSISPCAVSAACSGVTSSRTTRANIVGITNVLNTSSTPAVA